MVTGAGAIAIGCGDGGDRGGADLGVGGAADLGGPDDLADPRCPSTARRTQRLGDRD
jgi:hypothetical protein